MLAFLVRIGRIFEHAALRHLLFFGSEYAPREVFSMIHRIKHIVVGEVSSPCNRLRCHKIVN